jgi:predicted N-acyltransferase
MGDSEYRVSICDDASAVDARAWDRLVAADPDGNPFLRHAFFAALQESASTDTHSGWQPQFVTLWRGDELAALVPLYVKSHSFGEYVFDWSWAEAQEQLGEAYYPKLLVAVPFTPVAGSRLVAADERARSAAAEVLVQVARASGLSSLHVLFPPAAQADALVSKGMLMRANVQFHWRNPGYADFEDFLASLVQTKRKKIRAERRKVHEAHVDLERKVGTEITGRDWRFFQQCYDNTYFQHGSRPYLNLRFFRALAQSMPEHLMLVIARRRGEPIASALGVFDAQRSVLYGRYWGAVEHVPCLHFECCYYQMIEFSIERRLARFEGGAQGEHKLARGLDPVETRSVHWLRSPEMQAAVRRFVLRERDAVAANIDEMGEHRAFRERGPDWQE